MQAGSKITARGSSSDRVERYLKKTYNINHEKRPTQMVNILKNIYYSFTAYFKICLMVESKNDNAVRWSFSVHKCNI